MRVIFLATAVNCECIILKYHLLKRFCCLHNNGIMEIASVWICLRNRVIDEGTSQWWSSRDGSLDWVAGKPIRWYIEFNIQLTIQ